MKKSENTKVPATIAKTNILGGPLQVPVKLEFQFLLQKAMCWLTVEFDSYSRDRNLIQNIYIFGLPVDVPEMRTKFPFLYKEIDAAMTNNADTYYNEIENPDPILNRHISEKGVILDAEFQEKTGE